MAAKTKPAKDPAAVALGKGGKKGGLARAAKLTAEQRGEIARNAVQARWDRANSKREHPITAESGDQAADARPVNVVADSDRAVLDLLQRIKISDDPAEVRKLIDELERAIFHRQYPAA